LLLNSDKKLAQERDVCRDGNRYFINPLETSTMTKHTKNFGKRVLLATAIAAAIAAPMSAQATNGYTMHGFGTAQKGMAGAGSALPMDSLIVYSNPAGLTKLKKRFDLELSFFNPSDRSYTANDDFSPIPFVPHVDPGTYKSKNDWFLIPSLGMNWTLTDHSALALTLAGSGGMNTEYSDPVFKNFAAPPGSPPAPPAPAGALFPGSPPFPGSPGNQNGQFTASGNTGVNLQQALIALSYAHDINENNTLAISPILAIQSIKVKGLEPFKAFSQTPDKVTGNGTDYSYGGGVRIGYLGTFAEDRFSVGISYQTKLWMTDFDDYEGLLAEQGGFDIPARLNVGLAFKPIPQLSIAADWERIFYGQIDSLNNGSGAAPNSADTLLGADNGLGFGWDTINVFKIGVNYEVNDKFAVRAGYSHTKDAPFEGADTLFNIIAPATIKDHVSVGFSYQFNENNGLTFAYTRALDNKVKGQNEAFTGPQTGDVRMEQNIIDLAWNYTF